MGSSKQLLIGTAAPWCLEAAIGEPTGPRHVRTITLRGDAVPRGYSLMVTGGLPTGEVAGEVAITLRIDDTAVLGGAWSVTIADGTSAACRKIGTIKGRIVGGVVHVDADTVITLGGVYLRVDRGDGGYAYANDGAGVLEGALREGSFAGTISVCF